MRCGSLPPWLIAWDKAGADLGDWSSYSEIEILEREIQLTSTTIVSTPK